MALPSQSRPQSRHSHTFRRGRTFGFRRGRSGKRRPLLVAMVALLTITVGVWGYRALRSPDRGGPSPAVAMDWTIENEREATMPVREREPLSAPATAAPVERSPQAERPSVRMGESSTTSPQAPAEPATAREPVQTQPTQQPQQTQTARQEPAAQPDQPRESARPSPVLARESQAPPSSGSARERAVDRARRGMELIQSNRPVEARRALTQALDSGALTRADAASVRQVLGELNDRLIFSPEIVPDDPFTYGYAVRPGDSLSRIAQRESLNIDWRLVQRINRIRRPEQIRAGQHLKLVKGPFHAIVSKRDFRMDVYLGEGDERVFVRSFSVGLGEYDSTPIGVFRVRPNSKLIDPEWVNPRTGDRFRSKDPSNPIGNRWIGLEGVSEAVRDLGGYGIHGTIEPESIGTQASMGCIRMLQEDVELMYELMAEGMSVVEIRE